MIIVIASFPGTETKKMCKTLALRLGLRHLQKEDIEGKASGKEWEIARQRIIEEEKKGNFITDSMLASKTVGKALRIFLNAPKRTRAKNIAGIEKMTLAAALEKIEENEKKTENESSRIFGSAYFQPEEFDIMLNAERFSEESMITMIEKFLEKIQK